jgi:hypothetical protein
MSLMGVKGVSVIDTRRCCNGINSNVQRIMKVQGIVVSAPAGRLNDVLEV